MKGTHHCFTHIRSEAALLLALLLLTPVASLAGEKQTQGEETEEMDLHLIMSPGTKNVTTITFSTDTSKPAVKRSTPLIEIPDLDTGVDPDLAFSLNTKEERAEEEISAKNSGAVQGETVEVVQQLATETVVAPVVKIQADRSKTQHTISNPVLPPGIEEEMEDVVATEPPAPARKYFSEFRPDIKMSSGYRSDTLSYSMLPYVYASGNFSEVEWDDLDIFEVKAEGKWSGASGLYLRGNFGLGWIDNNEVEEPGYISLGKDIDKDQGTVMDASAGVGYRISAPSSGGSTNLHFIPMVGYGYNDQDLLIRSGVESLHTHYYLVTDIVEDGDTTYLEYQTSWKGPWLGADMVFEIGKNHSLSASLAYHFLSYDADTKFINDDTTYYPLFEHSADGGGVTGSLAYQYDFAENWFINFQFDYKNYWADGGTDTSYYTDDGTTEYESVDDLITRTVTLDEVKWESYSFLFGIGFIF